MVAGRNEIVFAGIRFGNPDIFVMNPDGGSLVNITQSFTARIRSRVGRGCRTWW